MPRPHLPRLIPRPKVAVSFYLDAVAKKSIAKTLGLKKMPKRTVEAIPWAVNCYRATASGSRNTTIANVLVALRHIEKRGRPREDSLALLANDRAAVDYTTLNLLQPLAKAVQEGRSGSNEALVQAAQNRAAELTNYPRVMTATEPLRFFCGVLRTIFNRSTAHLQGKITQEEAWHRCRQFAIEIFTAAEIDHADFDTHPERLTEYLGTDVTAD
jgi:hypothetical protein